MEERVKMMDGPCDRGRREAGGEAEARGRERGLEHGGRCFGCQKLDE